VKIIAFSAAEVVIPAQGKAIVPTDIAIAVPIGTYGRVAPRSSLAVKHHLDVGAGVVDADYRGPLGVVLFNFGKEEYTVTKHERIAQLVLEKIITPDVVEVEVRCVLLIFFLSLKLCILLLSFL
jgi:dUTP pyrophosphatase